MSEEMQGIARISIHEGRLEEFKQIARRCVETVRAKEPGTIQYELYISEDGTECLVFERYRDSDAGLAHSENIGSLMKELSDVCTITGDVCGTPSPKLREFLDAAGVRVYAPLMAK